MVPIVLEAILAMVKSNDKAALERESIVTLRVMTVWMQHPNHDHVFGLSIDVLRSLAAVPGLLPKMLVSPSHCLRS